MELIHSGRYNEHGFNSIEEDHHNHSQVWDSQWVNGLLKKKSENHIFTPNCLGLSQYVSFTASYRSITSSSYPLSWIMSNMEFCYEQKAKHFNFIFLK